ncbi:MAG: Uma2 family endonuclease [Verrucomicrobiales bacterium]
MSTLVLAEAARSKRVPSLANGDWLKRDDFHRRYLVTPGLKKAELVEHNVVMPSPTGFARHGAPQAHVISWLGFYAAHRPGLELGDNATVILDDANELQPDALLRRSEESGGQSRLGEDGFIHGAPEFVAEIAATSAAYDCHQKKAVYLRHGVLEYFVWSVDEGRIDWWEQIDGDYRTIPLDHDGLARSRIFPGLWLDAHALIRGDLRAVFAAVQRGLDATP